MPLGVLVLLLVVGLVVWLMVNRPQGADQRPPFRPVRPVKPAPAKPSPIDEAEFRRQVRARAEAQRQAARQRDKDES